MKTVGHEGVTIKPEYDVVLRHVPDKQLAVGQSVLRISGSLDYIIIEKESNLWNCLFLHVVWHLHETQPPAHLLQLGPGVTVQDCWLLIYRYLLR